MHFRMNCRADKGRKRTFQMAGKRSPQAAIQCRTLELNCDSNHCLQIRPGILLVEFAEIREPKSTLARLVKLTNPLFAHLVSAIPGALFFD